MQIAFGAHRRRLRGGRSRLQPAAARCRPTSSRPARSATSSRACARAGDARVGDTVFDADRPRRRAAARLPGRASRWCSPASIRPTPSSTRTLRDALEKLQLNDASLHYEPETSTALGFGFRCGFLGLLHMEIVQERLEREFDLDLVTTVPSVEYHVYQTDGTMDAAREPGAHAADPASIDAIEEPYVKARIMAPAEYIGADHDAGHRSGAAIYNGHALPRHGPRRVRLRVPAGRDHPRLLRQAEVDLAAATRRSTTRCSSTAKRPGASSTC